MSKKCTWIWLTLSAWTSQAQINESDTLKYQLNLGARGSYQSGNVELLRLTGEMEGVIAFNEDLVLKSQNTLLYQEFFSVKADQDILSQNYVYFRPENRWYPYLIVFISTNFRREIDLRTFAGGGITCEIFHRKTDHSLKLSANLVYEESEFSAQTFNLESFNGSQSVNILRNTFYLRGRHRLKNQIVLYYDLYYQQSLESQDNFRYQVNGGVDIPVWKSFYLSTRASYNFENLVTLNTLQRDFIWVWGGTYKIKSDDR